MRYLLLLLVICTACGGNNKTQNEVNSLNASLNQGQNAGCAYALAKYGANDPHYYKNCP